MSCSPTHTVPPGQQTSLKTVHKIEATPRLFLRKVLTRPNALYRGFNTRGAFGSHKQSRTRTTTRTRRGPWDRRAGEAKGIHFWFSSVFCTNWSKADRDVGMRCGRKFGWVGIESSTGWYILVPTARRVCRRCALCALTDLNIRHLCECV
jgi:hypothetical protein